MPQPSDQTTFHRLVANTGVASVTNNFLWFALTFWVYLETRSVTATAVIGGTYMLLLAGSGLLFGTFVDGHRRKSAMLLSSVLSLVGFAAAAVLYAVLPPAAVRDLTSPGFWLFTVVVLAGGIAGNLRTIALSTSVTLLVAEDRRDKANGLVGTVNGIAFALTSVFSGLAIGLLGMGWSLGIAVVLTALALVDLATIGVAEDAPAKGTAPGALVDFRGAAAAIRVVPGLLALIVFTTFNNLLGGVYMALMDPYGLTLVSVEVWGILLAVSSAGFIVGGVLVASRGLGPAPVRTLLLANVAMWAICVLFPLRSSAVALTVAFTVFTALVPVVEAAEQTVIQRVVPFAQQGRVMGAAQSLETLASPVSTFLIGPLAELVVIPLMVDGAGARLIGGWFGTGPDRGMALMFILAGLIGLAVTLAAFGTRGYRRLSASYAEQSSRQPASTAPVTETGAGTSRRTS